MSDDSSTTPTAYILSFLLGAVVLAYIGGAFSAVFHTFPYPQLLEKPFKALYANWEKEKSSEGSRVNTALWHDADYRGKGVTQHVDGRAYEGLTFYTTAPLSGAALIDMQGQVVHKWELPFREAWPDGPPHIDEPVPENNIYWRRAKLMPDGDVVATYAGTADTPWGYGLIRVDKDSNLVWKYAKHTHHDVDIRPDGSVYALVQKFRDTKANPLDGVPQMSDPVLEDFIVRLSPEGEEVERLSLFDLLVDSPYREALQMYPVNVDDNIDKPWDPLHTNNVEVVGSDFAEHHEFVDPDHLLISSRTTDLVAILDFQEPGVVWATRGIWKQQHDPDPLPNGHLMVFDNNGHGGPEGASRLLEYDPTTGGIAWSYLGAPDRPFSSTAAASQDPLPNGNVLATSSIHGRLFEVTRDGEIVWEFLNRAQKTVDGKRYVALICGAERFAPEELTFLED